MNDLWEYDIVAGNWRWLTGSNGVGAVGNYGTKGVPAASNVPGARQNSSRLAIGNKLFLVGGIGYGTTTGIGSLNDVWEYDLRNNIWTWVKGSNLINQLGKYDPQGPASANITGGRNNSFIAATETNAYMFGGTGFATRGISEQRGDLWAITYSDKLLPILSNFPEATLATYGDPDLTPTAQSTNTSTPITYTSADESIATIVNGKIRILKAGTVTISANQAENGQYSSQSIDQVLTIQKAQKTITFNPLPARKVGNAPFTLQATSPSESTITFESSNPGIVSIVDNVATIMAAGTVNITASQAEDENYLAAQNVVQTQLINTAEIPDPAFAFTNGATTLTTTYGKASANGTFNVSGSNLTSGVEILVETPYSISLDQINYSNTITLGTTGTLNSTPIYFHIDPTGAADTYAGQVTFSTTGAEPVTASLGQATVHPSPLTINALNGTKVYGTSLYSTPASINFTADSLRNGDQIAAVTLTYMAGSNSIEPVNIYPGSITPSDPAGANGFYNGNYLITYNTGALHVLPAPITVKADALSKQFGTSDPELTYTITNGSLFGSDSFSGTLVRDAGENTGIFPINRGALTAGPNYDLNYISAPFTITQSASNVTFAPIGNLVFGQADQPLTVTSSSPAPITYLSTNPEVAIIIEGQLHIVGTGTTTIRVTQAGDANNPPNEAEQIVTVTAAPATIVLSELSHVYNGNINPVVATTSPAGLTGVTLTYNGSTTVPSDAGTYEVLSTLVNSNFVSQPVTASLVISKAEQTISLDPILPKNFGDTDFIISGSGGLSNNPVTLISTNPAVATILNGIVHIVSAGTTNIIASQEGNINYNAALQVVQPFSVNRATAAILLSSLSPVYDGSAKTVTATTSPEGLGGLTIYYNGSLLAPIAAGIYEVIARLENPNYEIIQTNGTLTIAKAEQVITFTPLAVKTFGDADFALTATGGASGSEITYTSSNTNVATIVEGTIQIVGAGTTIITASQAGNTNYNAAADVAQTLVVNQATASVSLAGLTYIYDGSAKAAVATTNPEGLAGVSVTYDGSATAPGSAGSYTVLAKLLNPNYTSVETSGTLTINKAGQVITFTPLAVKTFGDADFALTATGGASGSEITYTSSNTNAATVVSGNIHIVGAGTTIITASQAGNTNYNAAADVAQTLVVNQATASVSLAGLTYIYDGSAKTVVATTNPEGLAGVSVTYDGSATAPGSAGSYSVLAKLVNPNYTSVETSGTLTINKAGQVITFTPLAVKTFGDADFALTATGGASGSEITYTSSNTNVATVVSGNIHIVGAGTTIITASQAGNTNFNAAADVAQTLVVNQATAYVSLAGLTYIYDGSAKTVVATTNPEGLAGVSVTYDGSATAPSSAGSYTVLAKLLNPNYTSVETSGTLTINKAGQVITFTPLAVKTFGDADFALTATGGASGSEITYTSSNTNVATVVYGNIHIVGAGTTIITASQAGNTNYNAAADVTQTLVVNQAAASLSLSGLEHFYNGSQKIAIATTTPFGLSPVNITYNGSGAAPTEAGTYSVNAQLDNSNYNAASATGDLVISKANQVITFAPLDTKTVGDGDFALSATGGASGNAVTYTSSNTDVATVIFGTVHIVGAGTATLSASQSGSANFNAAPGVSQVLTVNKGVASIVISSATYSYDGAVKTLAAMTLPAGLTGLSYSYNGSATAPSAAGVYTVIASLVNANYTALPATATLTIVAPVTVGIKVQYRNADTNPGNNESKPFFKIVNNGQSAAPYNQLTMRYWITPENYTGAMSLFVDYAQIGANKVIMKYVPLADPRIGALGYIEYSFNPSAGSIIGGANSGEIQSRFANSDWTNFNDLNDHSYIAANNYVDAPGITLYKKGELVWGTEPVTAALSMKLKVYSQEQNNGANTISTTLDIRNEGNVAIDFKDLRARYWFTPDGTSPLKFAVDYAKVGNSAVTGTFNTPSPLRVNGGTYLELQVKPTNTNFYPLTSTGDIQYRVNKNDWSNFNQVNDYSYVTGAIASNPKITLYHKGILVYGTEPAVAGPVTMMVNSASAVKEASASTSSFGLPESQGIIVYPNPSTGNFALQMNDVRDGAFTVLIHNETGKILNSYSGNKNGDFRKDYQLDLPKGMFYMVIIWKDHKEFRTILIDK